MELTGEDRHSCAEKTDENAFRPIGHDPLGFGWSSFGTADAGAAGQTHYCDAGQGGKCNRSSGLSAVQHHAEYREGHDAADAYQGPDGYIRRCDANGRIA
jgi:hypothetical protein